MKARAVLVGFGAAAICVLVFAMSALGVSGRSPDPGFLVLRPADIPAVYSRYEGDYENNADAAKESGIALADYIHWGRISGYDEKFQTQTLVGQDLVTLREVDSSASTYKSSSGATKSLHATYRSAEASQKVKRLPLSGTVGDEARLYRATTKQSGTTVAVYVVSWRYKTVKASIVTAGVDKPRETVVALARKQQRRIAVAVG